MRKTYLVILTALSFFLSFCGAIDQNVQARKDLAKCKYDLEKLDFNKLEFSGLVPKSVWFDVYLKITNTAKHDVVLDHVKASILLNDRKITEFTHKNFVKIVPDQSVIEKLAIEIAFDALFSAATHKPESIGVQASVFINILIGPFTLKTPFEVKVKKTFAIPYEKIEQELKRIKDSAVEKAKELKDTAKNKLKKIF